MTTPQPRRPKTDPWGAPWPGLVPLRPLRVGEILGAAAVLVRARAALLIGISLAVNLVGSLGVLGYLANRSDLDIYLNGSWAEEMLTSGRFIIPDVVLWPMIISLTVPLIGTIVVSAITAVFATEMAIGQPPLGAAVRRRLTGRWVVLVGITLLTALMIGIGFALFILPGLLALATVTLAVPVAAIEGGSTLKAIRRSIRLSTPVMWRILGVLILTFLASMVLSTLLASIIGGVANLAPWTSLVVSELAGSLLAAVITPWSAAVVAVLYIDTRIRTEQLGPVLWRASQSRPGQADQPEW